jgi:hypothetical protein
MTRSEIKIAFVILLIVILSIWLFNFLLSVGIILLVILGVLYLIKKVFFS